MKKSRILVSAVLTAGLGLTGVVSASASGTSAPEGSRSGAPVLAAGSVHGKVPGKGHGGPFVVCVFHKGSGDDKPGRVARDMPSKTTVKVVNGKVYLNGKLLPGGKSAGKSTGKVKFGARCPALPALPGLVSGKPGQIVTGTATGGVSVKGKPGGNEYGLTTSSLNG